MSLGYQCCPQGKSTTPSHLHFEKKGKVPYLSLELSLINWQGIERKENFRTRLEPRRSKRGRISGYPKEMEGFLLDNIKEFNRKYQSSK